jgi:predicted HicB family RNase H-like nuclease
MKARVKQVNEQPADYYFYTVAWSTIDEVFVARVAEFPSLAAHGNSRVAALREIESLVESVIEELKETGEPIPEPFSRRTYSGKLNVRMPQELHRRLATEASQQGVSLNDWINHKLAK